MAAPRFNQPEDAEPNVERLASIGHSTVGLAKFFGVSRSVIARWFKEDEKLEECYEQGRDSYRQTLEEQIIQMTMANKNPAGLIYLLKAKFKMYDQPSSKPLVDLSVNPVQNVLVVRDHGDDAAWAAKCAAQQRALTAECSAPLQIEAPQAPQVYTVASFAAPAILPPVYAPTVAPVAPSYGPPMFDWQRQPARAPIHAPEPFPSAPVAPSWTAEWRPRA